MSPTDADPGGDCVVIGAGPAGLTAAYELARLGRRALVLEAADDVGGLSRTCEHAGYLFDLGGHRFFTKVDYVQQLWEEILGDELLERPRLSRIHYKGHLFAYPLEPLGALRGLGPIESVRIGCSYAAAALRPRGEERTFEQWVTNRFGRRLYEIFFKTYTEKVWGRPCSEISADWAAQRIKDLDLRAALASALPWRRARGASGAITTLIERFHYPRRGPGQMWRRCAELLLAGGSEVRLDSPVRRIRHDGRRVLAVGVQGAAGAQHELRTPHLLASMPLRDLLEALDPAPPPEVGAAARGLGYRDFLTVVLVVDRCELFEDNWIYVHSPDVRVGRIQNFKNWSPDMVPDPGKTALGLEYFVQQGDALWSSSDAELVDLARRELDRLGLAPADAVEDGVVVRVPKAYPVYDAGYRARLAVLRGWLATLGNLQLIGRNGQHRYNNQDHSMMTGVLAARNLAGERHDVWAVNVEADYLEGGRPAARSPGAPPLRGGPGPRG